MLKTEPETAVQVQTNEADSTKLAQCANCRQSIMTRLQYGPNEAKHTLTGQSWLVAATMA